MPPLTAAAADAMAMHVACCLHPHTLSASTLAQLYSLVHLAQYQAIEEGAEEAVQAAQAGAHLPCLQL